MTLSTLARPLSAAAPERVRVGRIASIDGLRAIAVLAVMAFHFGLPLPGGFLGVDLFFVISGFVITRLLLREHLAGGRRRLAAFWLARAKRLLPALFVVLGAVQIWIRTGAGISYPFHSATETQTLGALGYAANWVALARHIGYWHVTDGQLPLTHLWSLAVEEQFYALWPFLLLVLLRFARPEARIPIVGVAAAAAYLLGMVLFDPANYERSYEGTDTRAGALLLGALVALAAGRPVLSWTRHRLAAYTSVAALAVLWGTASIGSFALHAWELPLAGVAAATLIAYLAAGRGNQLSSVLSREPLQWLGRISYGMYLWHWPIWIYLGLSHPDLARTTRIGLATVLTIAIASCSFLLLEQPIRRGRATPRVLLPAFAAAIAVIAISSACFQPAKPAELSNQITISSAGQPAPARPGGS